MKYNEQIVTKWFAEHGIAVTPEHRFDDKRKWRFDFAIPASKVAIECEGGVWTGGRHTRPTGFVKDMEKYNKAACLGWRILRVVPSDICTMDTINMVKEAIG